jgi:Spy/CpxP family protein refolding chaperone
MKRKLFATLAMLIVLSLVATPMLSGPPQRERQGHPHPHLGRMIEELGITPAQQEQLEPMIDEFRRELGRLQEQVAESRRAVARAIHAESFDETAIRDAVAATAELEADLAVERARGLHAILDQLNPEQREQARAMMEQRAERGFPGHRMGKPHGRRHHRELDN